MPRLRRRSPAHNDVMYRGKSDADSPGVSAGTLGFAAADKWSALRECGRAAATSPVGAALRAVEDAGPYGGRQGGCGIARGGAGTLGFAAADQWSALRECGRGSSSTRRRQPRPPSVRTGTHPRPLAQGRLYRISHLFCGDRIRAGLEGGGTAGTPRQQQGRAGTEAPERGRKTEKNGCTLERKRYNRNVR